LVSGFWRTHCTAVNISIFPVDVATICWSHRTPMDFNTCSGRSAEDMKTWHGFGKAYVHWCALYILSKDSSNLSFDIWYIHLPHDQAPVHTPSDRSSADPSLDLAVPRPIGYILYQYVSICINGACCNRIAHNAHRGNTTQAPAVAPNSNTETSAAHSQCCLHSIARPSVQPYFIKIFFPMSDSKALPKAGVGCWRHGMTRDGTGRSSVGHGRSPAQQGSCNCCLDV
jgi:hypothetical protein